jgi:hypothetical protein
LSAAALELELLLPVVFRFLQRGAESNSRAVWRPAPAEIDIVVFL